MAGAIIPAAAAVIGGKAYGAYQDNNNQQANLLGRKIGANALLSGMDKQIPARAGVMNSGMTAGPDGPVFNPTQGPATPARPVMSEGMQRGFAGVAFPEMEQARLMSKLYPAPLSKDDIVSGPAGMFNVRTQKVIPGTEKSEELTPWQQKQVEHQNATLDATNRRLDTSEARAAAATAAATAAEERRNRPQATPYVNGLTGNPVRLDPASQSYMDGDQVVSSNDLVPAPDFGKQVEKGRAIASGISQAQSILDRVTNNKSAFDKDRVNKARLRENVPFYGKQMAADVFTTDENTLRANVARESAMIINELYGAALSAGESARASTFAPSPDDTLEMLLPKLTAAVDWAKTQEKGIIPGAAKKARAQLGMKGEPVAVAIPDGAVAALKQNPERAAEFDSKFGPGASQKYLAGG